MTFQYLKKALPQGILPPFHHFLVLNNQRKIQPFPNDFLGSCRMFCIRYPALKMGVISKIANGFVSWEKPSCKIGIPTDSFWQALRNLVVRWCYECQCLFHLQVYKFVTHPLLTTPLKELRLYTNATRNITWCFSLHQEYDPGEQCYHSRKIMQRRSRRVWILDETCKCTLQRLKPKLSVNLLQSEEIFKCKTST